MALGWRIIIHALIDRCNNFPQVDISLLVGVGECVGDVSLAEQLQSVKGYRTTRT
jgi:hypothetical protein